MIPDVAAPASAPPRGAIWFWALVPLVLLAALIAAIVRLEPAERLRPEGMPPVERLKIERATLAADGIHLTVMNDGPDAVTIAQVTVDDAYWAFTSERGSLEHLGRTHIHVPYPWVAGEAHLVKILTSTGTPFEHEIAVAVETPRATAGQLAAFALIGLYVGVLPVALGLCWFPVLARLGRRGLDVLLAVTIGLLAFLFVDAVQEGLRGGVGAGRRVPGDGPVRRRGRVRLPGTRGRRGSGCGPRARAVRPSRSSRRIGARAAHRDRHRPAQLRRRAGDRRGVRAGRGRARHAPHRRLHAAQHDRGAGDPRADREGASVDRPADQARADRRRPDDRRGVARRLRLLTSGRGPVPRPRRRRDRPGHPSTLEAGRKPCDRAQGSRPACGGAYRRRGSPW